MNNEEIKYMAKEQIAIKKEMEKQQLLDDSLLLSQANVTIPYQAFEKLKNMAILSIDEYSMRRLYAVVLDSLDLDENVRFELFEVFEKTYNDILEENKQKLL